MVGSKIDSGIFGLNALLYGGFIRNSTTVVIGASGAGKTTLATRFLRKGLDEGQDAIFLTLDERPEQLIQEIIEMGWPQVEDHIDSGAMVFVDAAGKHFADFVRSELTDFVSEWAGHDARIVIDPLTPVLWSIKDRYQQREIISQLLRECRKVGTVLCTLEEHGLGSNLSGPETVIPMYLADNTIHLHYDALANPAARHIQIIKCRSSRHSRYQHPYVIIRGTGLFIYGPGGPPTSTPLLKGGLQEEVEARFADLGVSLSKRQMADIRRLTRHVEQAGLEGVDPEAVIDAILREFAPR